MEPMVQWAVEHRLWHVCIRPAVMLRRLRHALTATLLLQQHYRQHI